MKKILLSLVLIGAALSVRAQSVSNIVVTCVLQLDNGINLTNSVNSKSATVFAAATNSMTAFNLARASQDPPKVATTNLSNYFVQFTAAQFGQYQIDYDAKMQLDLAAKTPVITTADKDAIRAILAKY